MDENIEKLENEQITENAEVALNSENKEMPAKLDFTDNTEVQKQEKTEIVGVRFKKEGKTYYFAPNGFSLKKDDKVIVDTSRGIEYGFVAVPNSFIKTEELVLPLRGVVRIANEEDKRIHSENLRREIEAYNACIALIDEYNPKMKLIDVECAFDRSKLLFYFSAEERVDFREIVKALATTFHTRIEMRQIGIRDEAKMLGGLGVCGRPFCCSSFLTDFVQVSVKMAKEQNISLNAAKISGACGKLMCCLRYEYDTYLAEKALTPKVGTRVVTPDGAGEVTESNPLAGIIKVRLDGKSDDSEQTVYVREDVVKEEEYNGEKLTKTEVPNRGKSKDEEDSFVSFASIVSGSAGVETKGETSKPAVQNGNSQQGQVGSQVKTETENKTGETKTGGAAESENTLSDNENRKGGNRRRKKKHKGHNRGQNGGQGGEQRVNPVQNHDGQNVNGAQSQNRNRGGQNVNSAQLQNQNGGGQNSNSDKAQNPNNKNGQNHHGHGKRRRFRPHNKNSANNANKGGQGGE